MAQQPTWRGHRAPVEDPERPHGSSGHSPRRRSRRVMVAGILLAATVVASCTLLATQLMGEGPTGLPDIAVGSCLRSAELASGSADLHDLDTVSCNRLHDGEVYAVREAAAGEDLARIGEHCLRSAADRGVAADLGARDLEVRPLALTNAALRPGDAVACFVRHQHGTPLRGAVFTTGSDR